MSIRAERLTAKHTGSLVIFMIGMRINHFHKVGKWWMVARAMQAMLKELEADPDAGFLGLERYLKSPRDLVMVQYWESFDKLEAYSSAKDREHWPAMVEFHRRIGMDGTVGIWHETYCVPHDGHEVIYGNMSPTGLGRMTGLIPATGSRAAARQRMGGK